MVGPGWLELSAAVGSPSVVVGLVLHHRAAWSQRHRRAVIELKHDLSGENDREVNGAEVCMPGAAGSMDGAKPGSRSSSSAATATAPMSRPSMDCGLVPGGNVVKPKRMPPTGGK